MQAGVRVRRSVVPESRRRHSAWQGSEGNSLDKSDDEGGGL